MRFVGEAESCQISYMKDRFSQLQPANTFPDFFTLAPLYYSIITLYILISFPIVVTCDSSTCVGG